LSDSDERPRRPAAALPARRLARELAMKIFFEMDLTGRDPLELFGRYIEDGSMQGVDARYAERLVRAIAVGLSAIDERIAAAAPAFPVDQLATVDRNVLRVAICELGDDFSVPPKVVINEAIEIAKDYGGEASGRFVNGALGAVVDAAALDEQDVP
jgi:N utilization substance protein B